MPSLSERPAATEAPWLVLVEADLAPRGRERSLFAQPPSYGLPFAPSRAILKMPAVVQGR